MIILLAVSRRGQYSTNTIKPIYLKAVNSSKVIAGNGTLDYVLLGRISRTPALLIASAIVLSSYTSSIIG